MNEFLDPTDANFSREEKDIDRALRPESFDDFAGQESILENLKVFVAAANQREEALDHTLFHGPPGLGKTTLAYILAAALLHDVVEDTPVKDMPEAVENLFGKRVYTLVMSVTDVSCPTTASGLSFRY